MKSVLLKLNESTFRETEKILSGKNNVSRNSYFNAAIEHYNKIQKRQILSDVLKAESELVRAESINVLMDFEKMDDADQAI
jgi:hypothetical protein